MLSIGKLLCSTANCSSVCEHSKLLCRYTLLLRRSWQIECRSAFTVPEQYLVDKRDIEKYKLPPEIKELQPYILYSDYIESKKLKLGRKANYTILSKLKKKAEEKQEILAHQPVYSVMLKYLREDIEKSSKSETVVEETTAAQNGSEEVVELRSTHMPYAATDTYEQYDEPREKTEEQISDLDEDYKSLYEEYLKEKQPNQSMESFLDSYESSAGKSGNTEEEETEEKSFQRSPNIPPNWMADYEQYDDYFDEKDHQHSYFGTPKPDTPVTSIPCGGCGALLHCKDPAIPGYLPSELLVENKAILKSSVCQRCHFLKHYKTNLEVKVSPEEYPVLLSHIKKQKVAVILMVDLTDFPCSIWPGMMDIIGKTTRVYVVGNKVDLLPSDGKNCLANIKETLITALDDMGIGRANIKSVDLISAKTGFGVEQFISMIQKSWEYKGDIYMIGCTNVGKSSLFNALLASDYCKAQASNLIQRATVSTWPGTTLNLLKFPILSPVGWRRYERVLRLSSEQSQRHEAKQFRQDEFVKTKSMKLAVLQDSVGSTFKNMLRKEGPGYIGTDETLNETGYLGIDEKNDLYKNSRWCYDTPGAIHPDQVLHLLTTEELLLTLPQRLIRPRTFDLFKGYTLFLAGLGRLDLVEGHFLRCTVFASDKLPVTVCKTVNAEDLYQKLLRTEALAVPINDPERLKIFPELKSKDFTVYSENPSTSAADVVLSSAGWVALTMLKKKDITVRAWTPEGRGIYLRRPAMLSRSVQLRGQKVPHSPAFTRGKLLFFKYK